MASERRGGVPVRIYTCSARRQKGAHCAYPIPVVLLLLTALALLTTVPAGAQGPESYALPHLFSLPTATTARQFGMGGMTACLPDVGFPNPAFAGMLTSRQGGLRLAYTSFDGGLDLTGTQGWYAQPIGPGQGIQVLGMVLDSSQGNVMTPGGPLPGSIEETDAAVHYGRRLSDRWLVGVGVAPLFETEINLYHPATGATVMHTDSEATSGFRLGALYQFAPEGFVGLVFDRYEEDVTFTSVTLPGPANFGFTSTEWALGISARLSPKMTAAAEWMELEAESGNLSTRTDGLHVGLEFQATRQLSVRLGSNDGQMALGAGARVGDWVINYAYLDDWNDSAVGASLGESETHQIEIGTYW